MADAGLLGDSPVTLVAGPEEYLFGEEKALLEVIEGNDPLPRWLPPYVHGLFATTPQVGWSAGAERRRRTDPARESNPTLVNNVETLANVAADPRPRRRLVPLASGTDGVARARGLHRRRRRRSAPGVVEVELGHAAARGASTASAAASRPGRRVKAVLSGVANAVLDRRRTRHAGARYEGFAAVGSGLGSAGFIVYDDTACMVDGRADGLAFLYVESCGQCPPCKLGTGEITGASTTSPRARRATPTFEQIDALARDVTDANRCFLGSRSSSVLGSLLRAFPDDFAAAPRASARRRAVPGAEDRRHRATASRPTTNARCASGPTGPTPTA